MLSAILMNFKYNRIQHKYLIMNNWLNKKTFIGCMPDFTSEDYEYYKENEEEPTSHNKFLYIESETKIYYNINIETSGRNFYLCQNYL